MATLPHPNQADQPSPPPTPPAPPRLVPISDLAPNISIDLRYASKDNFTNRLLYPKNFPALLHPKTAAKLASAARALAGHDLHLKVWDAYRPPEAHRLLWQHTPKAEFVADPSKNWSSHCYGVAVDVTLADPAGKPLPMPTRFDEFSDRAASRYLGTDTAIRSNLTRLQKAMTDAGFTTLASEWWHFKDATTAATLDQPLFASELGFQHPAWKPRPTAH